MSVEENKAVVKRFIEEVQNQYKLELVDQLFDPSYKDHASGPGIVPGIEGFKQFFGMMLQTFPDLHATIHDQIAEGDKVVTRKTFSGTHKGDFRGLPPTGKQIELGVIDIFRISGGRIAEHWMQADFLGLMQQLGMIPPPGPVNK
jgi:steroid delta-isomerase-like uncharacterized protein